MRVIITGGTGLIGHRLSYRLLKEGHEVVVLSRNSQAKKMPPNVQGARWDGYSSFGWGHLLDENTVIINLAGENAGNGRWTGKQKNRILASRVDSSEAVVEAISYANQKPYLLIQASAVGYYGDRKDEIVTEKTPAGDGFLSDVCVEWEGVIKDLPIRKVVLRIGDVLSREGGYLPGMRLAARMAARKLGSGKQWVPWVHIEDVANAVIFLIANKDVSGPYNLASPNPVTNEQFMKSLGHAMSAPRLVGVPSLALKLAIGEKSDAILDSLRVHPDRLTQAGFRFQYPEIAGALDSLLGREYARKKAGYQR